MHLHTPIPHDPTRRVGDARTRLDALPRGEVERGLWWDPRLAVVVGNGGGPERC